MKDFLPKQNTLNCILKKMPVERPKKYSKYLSLKTENIKCFTIFLSGYERFEVRFDDLSPSDVVSYQERREMLVYDKIVITKKYLLNNWEIIYEGIKRLFMSEFDLCIFKVELYFDFGKNKYMIDSDEFFERLGSCPIRL